MEKLPIDQFLRTASRKQPGEFIVLTVFACNYGEAKINQILKTQTQKESVRDAQEKFHAQCQKILALAKNQGFTTDDEIEVFSVINFLI